MKAIRIHVHGGPEVLSYEDIDAPMVSGSQLLIKVEAAGVNFIDVYQRSGDYKIPLPAILGMEGAGKVVAIGPDAASFKIGDRVAYTSSQGSYAEYASVPEDKVVFLADGVSSDEGAAIMLQGCTAHYLCHSTYKVKRGDVCLVHAAAGGVGLLLTQMIKMLGGKVIATVSTSKKAELAMEAGADAVILYKDSDFEEEVKELTANRGVNVVYDSIGKTTFNKSINSLSRFGTMVLYGLASGPVEEFNPSLLGMKGSLFLTRPTLGDYLSDRETLEWRCNDLFTWLAEGKISLRLEHHYKLQDAHLAHQDLEARLTTGKVILHP